MAGDAGGFPLVARQRGDVKLAAAALLCPFLLPLDSVFYLLASRTTAAPRASLRIALCAPFFFFFFLPCAQPVLSIQHLGLLVLLRVSLSYPRGAMMALSHLSAPAHCRRQLRQGFVVVLCLRRASVISGSFSSAWWAMTTRGRRTIPMCVN